MSIFIIMNKIRAHSELIMVKSPISGWATYIHAMRSWAWYKNRWMKALTTDH